MNSQPIITETQLSRAAIYRGLERAYLLVRAVSCRMDFEQGGHAVCMRVLKHIEDERHKHWAKGTAFERQP